jgi:hypothetical protein
VYESPVDRFSDANGDEQNYGFKILAKMAYSDYFLGPDQVPGRSITLRDEVNDSVKIQKPGTVGSSIDFDKDPIHIHSHREYDIALTAYLKLYYRYYHALSPDAKSNIFNNLLTQRGKYDPGEAISLSINVPNLINVPNPILGVVTGSGTGPSRTRPQSVR